MPILYNGFRFARYKSPRETFVVVAEFPSVWWLHQQGFPEVVATMCAECSEEQAELIVSLVVPSGTVWAMPDGDRAGFQFVQSLLTQIASHRFVRWAKLGDGQQPTDPSAEQLKACLNC